MAFGPTFRNRCVKVASFKWKVLNIAIPLTANRGIELTGHNQHGIPNRLGLDSAG